MCSLRLLSSTDGGGGDDDDGDSRAASATAAAAGVGVAIVSGQRQRQKLGAMTGWQRGSGSSAQRNGSSYMDYHPLSESLKKVSKV